MGHKVHPKIFRMGITQDWKSKWFSNKNYAEYLEQDIKIRKYLAKKMRDSGIGGIDIERSGDEITVNLHTSKPGLVIGKGGAGTEELKKEIKKKFLHKETKLNLNIHEVTNPLQNSQIVCQGIIEQLEKRIPFRKAVKRSIEQVMQTGVKGVKIIVGGRLNGSEIARKEKFSEGSIPLHTLRANIEYARGAAATTYGAIGVKVWINKGEIFKQDKGNKK